MARQSLSKKVRYSVLARDGFQCRYCGARPDAGIVLVVDHIIPVVKGGTNDAANLITACQPCNAGKGAQTPISASPSPSDGQRMERERLALEEAAARAVEHRRTEEAFQQSVVNILCEVTGDDSFHASTAKTIAGYIRELGIEVVYPWIDKAASKGLSDTRMGRYVSGCRRIWYAQQPLANAEMHEDHTTARDYTTY